MSDEVFGTVPKNDYDEATTKALARADLTYKICNDVKAQIESMITPNPSTWTLIVKQTLYFQLENLQRCSPLGSISPPLVICQSRRS